jgi:SNF2 family DNA or RNA helicase
MGLGKTLMAVMMIKLAQPKPGFCIVIAPKTVGQQWQEECVGAFEQVRIIEIEHVDYQLM